MSTVPVFTSAAQALETLRASARYLTTVAGLPAETQASCLHQIEQTSGMLTAARSRLLRAFDAARGYVADGAYSPKQWLMRGSKVTRGEAAGQVGWARRGAARPQIEQAMAQEILSPSYAKTICDRAGKLPGAYRDTADAILVAAAKAGADLEGLFELIAEMAARTAQPDDDGGPGDGPQDGFGDRAVHLETTFGGAGVIGGDLTPECAAMVQSVLDSLSAPHGAEDPRTLPQRYHDALHEAMRWLVASDLLLAREGQARQRVSWAGNS